FSSRRRHTSFSRDWSSDVCSSDLLMDVMVSIAQLLLGLSFLVAVHELGHLLAAKYFGMRVEQFSIGFPPKIWSFKKGETEYAIRSEERRVGKECRTWWSQSDR